MMDRQAAIRLGMQIQIVMVMQTNEGPAMTALDLSRAMDAPYGTIYPVLADLERRKVIVGLWIDGPYPRRLVYRLAAKIGSDHA